MAIKINSINLSSSLSSATPNLSKNENWQFLCRFFENPTTIGSLRPSSKELARVITKYIPNGKHTPLRILEVGAGTGVCTEEIVKKMTEDDTLDIVEKEPEFCALLEKKFPQKNVRVHCMAIEDYATLVNYDYVISGLPLTLFSPKQVEKIMKTFETLTNSNGKISYFEYYHSYFSKLAPTFICKVKKILNIKDKYFAYYGFKTDAVLWNFPPARVRHLNMAK